MKTTRPNFLGIGAPKSGTTWLWAQLRKHPDVWMPPEKELHFFDQSPDYWKSDKIISASITKRLFAPTFGDKRYMRKGLLSILKSVTHAHVSEAAWWTKRTFGHRHDAWYVDLFSQAKPGQISGEISPMYCGLEQKDIARMRSINQEMRIIFMIREPIERGWSGMRFSASQKGWNISSVDEVMAWTKTHVGVRRGDYERTIDNYLQVFDSKNILVCFFDAITKDPSGLANSITSFLQIPSFPVYAIDSGNKINASPQRDMPQVLHDFLIETHMPQIESLSKRFGSYATAWEKTYSSRLSTDINQPLPDMVPAINP